MQSSASAWKVFVVLFQTLQGKLLVELYLQVEMSPSRQSGPKLPGVNGFLSLRLPKWITSNGDELVYKQRNSLYLQAAFPRVDEWYW